MLQNVLQNGIHKDVFASIDTARGAHLLFAIYKTLIIEGYTQSDDEDFIETYNETKNIFLNGIIKR